MPTPLETRTDCVPALSAEPMTIENLSHVLTRTLPQDGMDRMTSKQIEEVLSVPALTAHI